MRRNDLDSVIEAFDRLDEAIIDTSSIILAEKAGILAGLSETMGLRTVPAVAAEYEKGGGPLPANIALLAGPRAEENRPADYQVFAAAMRTGQPLISEDRKLLLRADSAGLVYYNALVMLEFLLYRHRIDASEYDDCKSALTAIARYAPRILAWAEGLHWAVVKRG